MYGTQPPAKRKQGRAALAASRVALAGATASVPAYVPAPRQYSVVYDGGAGYDPGSTGAQSVGQYADTNTNTVHTTKGFGKRAIAQDVGQIFGYSMLTPGDRNYFSKLLGTDPAKWDNLHGANPQGAGAATGDEAFADYYALAATGGLRPDESMAWGDISIDHKKLAEFTKAIGRLGKRYGLKGYLP